MRKMSVYLLALVFRRRGIDASGQRSREQPATRGPPRAGTSTMTTAWTGAGWGSWVLRVSWD